MQDQIIKTWEINNRVNIMLIESISDEGLECSLSKRGGRDVARQFAHLHYVRLYRIEKAAKNLLENQTQIDPKSDITRKLLLKRLNESSKGITQILKLGIENDGKVKGFKRGVIAMLSYLINHEGHHRGSIILTLKQCGYPVPKDIRDGIWAWNQI